MEIDLTKLRRSRIPLQRSRNVQPPPELKPPTCPLNQVQELRRQALARMQTVPHLTLALYRSTTKGRSTVVLAAVETRQLLWEMSQDGVKRPIVAMDDLKTNLPAIRVGVKGHLAQPSAASFPSVAGVEFHNGYDQAWSYQPGLLIATRRSPVEITKYLVPRSERLMIHQDLAKCMGAIEVEPLYYAGAYLGVRPVGGPTTKEVASA